MPAKTAGSVAEPKRIKLVYPLAIAAILILLGAAVMGWWFAWDATAEGLRARADAADARAELKSYARHAGETAAELEEAREAASKARIELAIELAKGNLLRAEVEAKLLRSAREFADHIDAAAALRGSELADGERRTEAERARALEAEAELDGLREDLAAARKTRCPFDEIEAEAAALRRQLAALRECAGDARRSLTCVLEA